MEIYNLIVIGFGKAGKTLAAKYAAEGNKVAVIEKDETMYGGTCINVGCIPSKSLVKNSQKAFCHPERTFLEKAAFYEKAIEEKRRLVESLREKNYQKLNQMEQVTVIHGEASFLAEHKIAVRTEEGTLELEGEKIVINTGATPVILPIEGIKENPYVYTSAGLLELTRLPEHLIIVGGGYIGLEFASIYSGFGSRVTVLQDGKRLIPREDEDIALAIRGALEKRGVAFCLGADIDSVKAEADGALVTFQWKGKEEARKGDAVLLATGRKPNTEGLNLDAAKIAVTSRGAVLVDENLRTNVPNVWAAGDVNGGQQFTYISLDDSRIIWSGFHEGDKNRSMRKAVPYSVFLSPAYSRVGLNETEARAAGYDFRVVKLPAAAIPKAQISGVTTGFLKALIDQKTDRILGAMLFCEESHEMINMVKLAMDLDAPYQVLRDQIFTHPTMSEALNDLFAL